MAEDKLNEIVHEHSERVFSLYQKSSKSFRTTFFGLLGFTFIILGLVFYPFVSKLGEEFRILQRLESLNIKLQQTKSEADLLHQAYDKINQVVDPSGIQCSISSHAILTGLEDDGKSQNRKIRNLRAVLRDEPAAQSWLQGKADKMKLTAALRSKFPILNSFGSNGCDWMAGDKWKNCTVTEKLGKAQSKLDGALYDRSATHTRTSPLKMNINLLFNDFRDWGKGKTTSFMDLEDNKDLGMRSVIDRYLDECQLTVRKWFVELSGEIQEKNKMIRELKGEGKNLNTQLQAVKELLNEIKQFQEMDTPLGRLPVGLNELVLLFPFLLAFGNVLCISQYSSTMKLRQSFHDLCRTKDPEQKLLSDHQVALIAPLWIDPINEGKGLLTKIGAFTLPFIGFLVAVIQLFQDRVLIDNFPANARLHQNFYLVLYVISLLAFTYGFSRIWKEFRQYSKK